MRKYSHTQIVAPLRRMTEIIPINKWKYVPVQEEPHSSEKVMAFMSLALECPEPVEALKDMFR